MVFKKGRFCRFLYQPIVNKMDYLEAIKYIYGQLPMYQRSGPAAYKNNLDNTLALDLLFDHPHKNFRTVHVAGTNGKGSVSHMMASVLQEAGYKVGLYTSPHLKDYRERIRINGEMISEQSVCGFLDRFLFLNKDLRIEPSFFELSVMMAFDYFSSEKVDLAVIEVGLGGRLDSTNIVRPEVAVITNISFDHMSMLGNSLPAIAAEKAGIIKSGIPVIIGELQTEVLGVFQTKASGIGAPIQFADQEYQAAKDVEGKYSVTRQKSELYSHIELDLKGDYQVKNLITVIAAIEQLKAKKIKIHDKDVMQGLSKVMLNTGLKARWQQIGDRPKVICDSGHNEAGIQLVVEQLRKMKYRQLHFVFGTVKDKDLSAILPLLPTDAIYYFTKADIDRAMNENNLRSFAVEFNLKGEAYPSVTEAFETAKKNAGEDDLIFIGGSTFVVAEVL